MLAGRPKKAQGGEQELFPYKLVNKSNNVPVRTSASKHEKISNFVSKHLLCIAMVVEGKTRSWVENEVRELEHFRAEVLRLRTGRAKFVISHGIPLSTDTLIVSLSPFSLACFPGKVFYSFHQWN